MSDLDRVRWQCRRGLLELDLVLARFVERHFSSLAPAEQESFKRLLAYPDNDLWDLIAGRREPQAGEPLGLIRLLRSA
jgi:antitoxin CptB